MLRLAALCLILVGCAARPAPEPSSEALIVVFADSFHSGIVLERSQVDRRLLPPAQAPWVAVHFGERRWISGEADGLGDAMRLVVWPGEGGVQVDGIDWWIHDRGGTEPALERVWVFTVSQQQLDRLRARLDSWIAIGATSHQIRPSTVWWPSSRAWSLRTNCHDFTVDLLAAAGIEVDQPPFMLAAPLRDALDRAWSALDNGR